MDKGHGFFMIKFDLKEDRTKVMEEGTMMIFHHYSLSVALVSKLLSFIGHNGEIASMHTVSIFVMWRASCFQL